jgi:WD40 repeat protein
MNHTYKKNILWSTLAPPHGSNDATVDSTITPLEVQFFGDQDRYLAVGWLDGHVDIFDTFHHDYQRLSSISCHKKSLIFSKDQQHVFTTSADCFIKKWNVSRWIEPSLSKGLLWRQAHQ